MIFISVLPHRFSTELILSNKINSNRNQYENKDETDSIFKDMAGHLSLNYAFFIPVW